jgi:predicted aspartyl protease
MEKKMTPYSIAYDPPAPVLVMTVASIFNRRLRQTLSALLDTGSDFTAIPAETIERLKLYPIRRLQFEDMHGNASVVFTYKIRIAVAEMVIPQLEVVPTGLHFGIVGRDLLNRFHLHLYGPQLAFEISP